jgi:hypothetical protein
MYIDTVPWSILVGKSHGEEEPQTTGYHENVSKGLPAQLEAEWQSSLVGKQKLTPDGKAPHWAEKYIS